MDKKVEEKILRLYKEKPYISYKEVMRQTGASSRRLMSFVKKQGIKPITKKAYVEEFIREHPFYTYAVVEKHVHYGQGNIARLAKSAGINRDPYVIGQQMKKDISRLYESNIGFDRNEIIEKYGVGREEIEAVVAECRIATEKRNHVTSREKIVTFLKETELDYTNIARIIGCDLGYVSRVAKDEGLQRNQSFAEALKKNIRYYLGEDNGLSCEEIRAKLNRCKIEKVVEIARELGEERKIVPEEEEIAGRLKSGQDFAGLAKEYGYTVSAIELVAIKFGILERDPEKDKKVVELLEKYPTCTYVEASNLLDYNVSLVSAVAAENGFNRAIINYGGENVGEIISVLKNNPSMTYKEIGKKVGRSSHTVWRIAKENNLCHKGKASEK